MAAVVGERCQEAAAEFPVRKHTFVPGQRVFSDSVNELLAGDGRAGDGMAKTAPMITVIAAPTEAMREAQHKVIKAGSR
jgi:hypothetical protein